MRNCTYDLYDLKFIEPSKSPNLTKSATKKFDIRPLRATSFAEALAEADKVGKSRTFLICPFLLIYLSRVSINMKNSKGYMLLTPCNFVKGHFESSYTWLK